MTLADYTKSLALALLMASGQHALAQDAQTDLPFPVTISAYTDDEAAAMEIAVTRNAWREAFAAQDVEAIMAFYVDDIYSFDMMAQPGSQGPEMAFDGSGEWRDNWLSFVDLFEDDLVVTFGEMTIYQSGDMATIQHLTRLEGTLTQGGDTFDMWARDTNVLRLIDDEWLIVHDHVSVPADFATGMAMFDLGPRKE